ncbi:hypothetical protein HDU96_007773 [Phlyctochytrium bullatum]|nr:hypothetical protein HDU96_007773 [Phlyctochytrium bullatum]
MSLHGAGKGTITQDKQKAIRDQLEKPSKVPSRLSRWLKSARRQFRRTKKCYYSFIINMLCETSANSYAPAVVLAIETLQLLSFCTFEIDWGPHGNAFGQAIRYTMIEEPLVLRQGMRGSLSLSLAFLVLFATLIINALVVLRTYLRNDFRGEWPIFILRYRLYLLDRIIFLPSIFCWFCLYTFKWGDLPSGPFHIIVMITAIPALVIHFGLWMLLSTTFFQPSPKSNNLDARTQVTIQIFRTSLRYSVAAVFAFGEKVPLFRSVACFVLSAAIPVQVFMFIPYFNKSFNIAVMSLHAQVAWGFFVGIIQAAYKQVVPEGNAQIQNYIFYGYLAGIPIIALASYFGFESRYTRATSIEVASKSYNVTDSSKFNTWEMEEEKPMEKETRFWHPSQVELATRFLLHTSTGSAVDLAEQVFLAGVQKYPNNPWLLLQYANFFAVYKNEKSVCLNYISKAKAKGLTPPLELMAQIFRNDSRSANAGKESTKDGMTAVDRLEFKQLLKRAFLYHKEAKASIANFWQTILVAEDDKPVDTSVLINLVAQMERCDDRASMAYKQLLQRYPLSVRVLQGYSVFLDEIHNNMIEAEEVRKKIKKIQDAGMSDEIPGALNPWNEFRFGGSPAKTKKEKQAYKEYRKQVYLYSRGISFWLNTVIRGVIILFVLVAIGQLLVVQLSIRIINAEVEYLDQLDDLQLAFPTVHRSFLCLQAANVAGRVEDFRQSISTVRDTIQILSTNSSFVFDRLSSRRSTYLAWGINPVQADVFLSNDVSPSRSRLAMPLRDATLLYVRHVYTMLDLTSRGNFPVNNSIFESSSFRFVTDNGLVILSDAYAELESILATEIRFDINLMAYLELGVWAFGMLSIIAVAFCVFMPMIRKAKRERETSLRAFLQIPKTVTQALFKRYYEPGATSHDDLADKGGDKDSDTRSEAAETNTDDEGNGAGPPAPTSADMDVLHTKAQSSYIRLTLLYSQALFFVGAAISIALACNYSNAREVTAYPGIFKSGIDIQIKTSRVRCILEDRFPAFSFPTLAAVAPGIAQGFRSTFDMSNPERPWASSIDAVRWDTEKMSLCQRNILYGNESQGIDLKPLAWNYNRYFFTPGGLRGVSAASSTADADLGPWPTGDSLSLFELLSMYIDSALRLSAAGTATVSSMTEDLRVIRYGSARIADGYSDFLRAYSQDFSGQLTQLSNVSIGMFTMVVAVLVLTFFLRLRPVLLYLVNTENERTLKLLLMIPVEIVADIDSLRELLHLRQRTKIQNQVITAHGTAPGGGPGSMSHPGGPMHPHPHGPFSIRVDSDHSFQANISGMGAGLAGTHGIGVSNPNGLYVPSGRSTHQPSFSYSPAGASASFSAGGGIGGGVGTHAHLPFGHNDHHHGLGEDGVSDMPPPSAFGQRMSLGVDPGDFPSSVAEAVSIMSSRRRSSMISGNMNMHNVPRKSIGPRLSAQAEGLPGMGHFFEEVASAAASIGTGGDRHSVASGMAGGEEDHPRKGI